MASSTVSPTAIAMRSPHPGCALLCSSPELTHASCGPNSPKSCLSAHPAIPLCGPPSTAFKLKSTDAARRKNSSPENLTRLHYNLLGKDSSGGVKLALELKSGNKSS